VGIDSIIRADALVLGAGPGGLTAALKLASEGVDVAVLEARGLVATRSNVVHLSEAGVEELRALGADATTVGQDGVFRPGTVPQHVLENGLRDLARQRGIAVHYDTRVTGFDSTPAASETPRWALAGGGSAEGKFVVGRLGIEGALGTKLTAVGAEQTFGVARYPHDDRLADGQVTGFLNMRVKGLTTTAHRDQIGGLGGESWNGHNSPRDGLYLRTNLTKHARAGEGVEQLHLRTVAPGLSIGLTQPVDAPYLFHATPAVAEHVVAGNLLAIGDAAGRVLPGEELGTTLAVQDGVRAADTITAALRAPERRSELLAAYEARTLASHVPRIGVDAAAADVTAAGTERATDNIARLD
jgi:2-polyprenyl-6-methoxyphenol hydroxylase-like FAD-dependent oxidoreductase